MDRDVQQAVDALLLEQGMYAPLELLLAEGRLRYRDYEQWRGGDLAVLETRLFGDREQCRRLLRSAAEYCAVLGFEPQTQSYGLWGGDASRGLCFSQHAATQRVFSTCYRKSAEQPQLDLFMDSTGSTLANAVVLALCERDNAEARRLLDRLMREDPGNSRLAGLEHLVTAAEVVNTPPADPEHTLATLETDLLPLADDLLGVGKRHFLMPQWQRLCKAFAGRGFNSATPNRHVSYVAAKADDWELVRDSVEAESNWQECPVLLRRHAHACTRLHQEEAALCDWFLLCWQFAEQASAAAIDASAEWMNRWRRFAELDPELPENEFPSWLLVVYPGLTSKTPDPNSLPDNIVPASYPIVQALARAVADDGVDDELIVWRRQLKDYSPDLFEHYMNDRRQG